MSAVQRVFAIVVVTAAVSVGASARQGAAPSGSATAPAAPLAPAREVVSRYVAAIGGADAFKAVRSIAARGRFEIGGVGLGGDFSIALARPNRFALRLNLGGLGTIEQVFDGAVGWTVNPASGPEVLAGRELTEAADEAWFDRTLYEPGRLQSLTTVERVTFDGRAAYKLKVVLKSGTESFEYFDVETGFLIGSESNRATPQGIIPTTTILRDYRRYGSLVQPTVLVQRALGVEQVLTVSSYEYDAVPDSAFSRPPEIAALLAP